MLMRVGQGVGDLRAVSPHLLKLHPAFRNQFRKRQAFDEFHDDISAVFFFTEVVNCGDVWMIQVGGESSLTQEASPGQFVVAKLVGEKLECHGPLQAQVAAAKYHPGAALPQAVLDFVMSQRLTDHAEPALLRLVMVASRGDQVKKVM